MTQENFEKIPEFFAENQVPDEEEDNTDIPEEKNEKPEPSILDALLSGFSEQEREKIKIRALAQCRLKIDQEQSIVDFESYKGNLPALFKELSEFFLILNKWDETSPLNLNNKFLKEQNLTDIFTRLSYLPFHPYLANLVEIINIILGNGSLDQGNTIETETVFQNFKKIYALRIQVLLLPFLAYSYNLDRSLLPMKKLAWQLLNKHGKTFEAAYIMDDIQKSSIRLKKAQELLNQEKYNLDEKIEINSGLLLLLSDPEDILYPVYSLWQEYTETPEINQEGFLMLAYRLDAIQVKPLSQQMLLYKMGSLGENIAKMLLRWVGRAAGKDFRVFLYETVRTLIFSEDFNYKTLQLNIRDIIFSAMETAKKKNWPVSEFVKDLLCALFFALKINGKNRLKMVSYLIACEFISGIIKIKYKIDEVVQGLAKGVIQVVTDKDFCETSELSGQSNYHQILCEFIYNGMWDTTLEIYPNLLTVEKNAELFISTMRQESQKVKIMQEGQEMKELA